MAKTPKMAKGAMPGGGVSTRRKMVEIGRNDPCPCGSGKKYKDCHRSAGTEFLDKLAQDEERKRLKAKRQQLKEEGVPWHKRLFVR